MNATTFCRSYIDLANQVLTIAQRPVAIEQEYARVKQESKEYTDYLGKFVPFFEAYPALKMELFTNLSNFKVGAFVEYQLDLFYAELEKIEGLKADIQKEVSGLRNDFTNESKEWLPKDEYDINGCYHYLDTTNIQQAIGFLKDRLARIKAKKQRLQEIAKAGQWKPEEDSNKLNQQEIEEQERKDREKQEKEDRDRKKKAQSSFGKGIGITPK